MNRYVIIGDVHGCAEELLALLSAVEYHPQTDRLVFTGDLVDRGPDSIGVVRLVRELGAAVVLGNHDEKHVRWARHEAAQRATGKPNPMRFAPAARALNDQLVAEGHVAWLASLPFYLRLRPRWVVVHAGFSPGVPLECQKPDVMTHVRHVDLLTHRMTPLRALGAKPPGAVFWTALWQGPESVIYGHNVDNLECPRVDAPIAGVSCIGIDTGCVFGGQLTACVLDTPDSHPAFVQVAGRAYAKYIPMEED